MKYDKIPVMFSNQWNHHTVHNENSTVEKYTFSPDGKLLISLDICRYNRHPVIEWGITLENIAEDNTKLVSDVDIASLCFEFNPELLSPTFVEMGGSNEQANDFCFLRTQLFLFAHRNLKCVGGRSSSHTAPYFNMVLDNIGYIMAIGWSGQWNAEAWRPTDEGKAYFRACMEDCGFIVKPHERIELPKMLICEWTGKEEDGYNLYRRFVLDQIVPKGRNGKHIELLNGLFSWGGYTQETHLQNINMAHQMNLGADCYWIDAGWYGDETCIDTGNDSYASSWWKYTGINDWHSNPLIYPDGMKKVADQCHDNNLDFLLWYEPEHVSADAKIIQEHPEWFMKTQEPDHKRMLNLGVDEAREWLTNRLSEDIENYHIRVLRIDFNCQPLEYWRVNDEPGRKGISEIKYNRALYRMWSELLKKFPDLIIDNCASGGRRLDYEALRYSIPFYRTDYANFADALDEGHQQHTYYLNHYIPINGTTDKLVVYTPVKDNDEVIDEHNDVQTNLERKTYMIRSRMNSGISLKAPSPSADENVINWYRMVYMQQNRIKPYTYGDYYPLTGASINPKDWIAWQMNLPDENRGMVMAFRRSESPMRVASFELRGIDRKANYVIENIDSDYQYQISGADLADRFEIEINKKRSSVILFYSIVQ